MALINIRGTSGSGKTHLTRMIVKRFTKNAHPERFHVEGRKQPLYYKYPAVKLAVLGHYETACGGCDTISDTNLIFDLAAKLNREGYHVIFEGLLISADVRRVAELDKKTHGNVHVLALDTPIEKCLEQVNNRRKARLGDKFTPVKETNTRSKHRGVELSLVRLKAEDVKVVVGNTNKLLKTALGILNGK